MPLIVRVAVDDTVDVAVGVAVGVAVTTGQRHNTVRDQAVGKRLTLRREIPQGLYLGN